MVGSLLVGVGLVLLRVELTIRTTGQVYAKEEQRIFAPEDGIVRAIRIDLGQSIAAGDILMELDDTDLALRVVHLERELAQADANLADNAIARRELELRPAPSDLLTATERKARLERIATIQKQIEQSYTSGHGQQIISELELRKQEIEKLRAEMELLKASIDSDWQQAGGPELARDRLEIEARRIEALKNSLGAELALVRARRGALVIRAAADGQVVALAARYPGMAVTRGAELVKLAPTNGPLLVTAMVTERNIDLLKVGIPARMESHVFDSMLEGHVKGRVQRVSPEAQSPGHPGDPAALPGRYEVDIAVHESPYPLVLGSRLDVRLSLGRRSLAEVLFRSARNLRTPNPKST